MGARCLVAEGPVGVVFLDAVGSGLDALIVAWGVLK